MFHIYRYAVGRESPRPAGDLLFMRTAAWKSLAISFAARTQVGKAIFASFCLLTKGRGCPVFGKRVLTMRRQTNHPLACGVVWPRGQKLHPFTRVTAATAFFRREKGSKTRRSPAANGMRPAAPPTPPNRWSKTPSSSCSRGAQISFFPLTSAWVHSRRRPAYLQQIGSKQNVP